MSNDTRAPSAHRSFLPRRSRGDHKLAGVAGGLGRAFGIDPVLLRVAFVVLAVFGGSGVLLYCLGWLLMPADGDEVSAVEALAGRGRSSVSPALTIVLIIVGLSSAGSMFSWGLPFWPVVIAAIVVFALVRHGRMGSCSRSAGDRRDRAARADDWAARADEFAERAAAWGQRVGERADEWTRRWADGAPATGTAPTGTAATGGPAAGTGTAEPPSPPPSPESPSQTPPPESPSQTPSPEDLLTRGRGTPPAWDPLGAAPFAWDLPDPSPEPASGAVPVDRGRGTLGRLFLGLALVTGGLLTGGVFAGWWTLGWATIAGTTLAVIGAGLLLTSLRGSGGRWLIGPGIFLSLVTLALTVTGISGTTGYGQQVWAPTEPAAVHDSYTWNAGQATLDLSRLDIPKGTTITTDLTVNGGQATILVPKDTTVDATCSARVGDVQCLTTRDNGMNAEANGRQTGDAQHGTLKIEVRSNAGQAEVRSNG